MYQIGDVVSINEIRDQFNSGDIELCARKKLLVEISLYKSDANREEGEGYSILLNFEDEGRPAGAPSIYGNEFITLDGGTDLDGALFSFGIGADAKVWEVGDSDN